MLILLVLARMPYHRPSLALGFVIHLVIAFAIYFFVVAPVPPAHRDRAVRRRRRSCARSTGSTGGCSIAPTFTECATAMRSSPTSHDLPDEWEAFLADAALDGRMVYQVQQLLESLTGRVQVRHLSENSFGSLVPARAYSAIKHLGDLAAGGGWCCRCCSRCWG